MTPVFTSASLFAQRGGGLRLRADAGQLLRLGVAARVASLGLP